MFSASSQIQNLNQLMDAAALRHRVISQNLANVNTPGYQRLDVQFEELLASQMGRAADSAGGLNPQVVEGGGGAIRADGNNVDVDQEVGELNRNSMLFQTYSQLLSSQFDMLRRATRGA